jgi:demethylmenaquinone methyltransferase/2-methoxy-6-polyprenyl-1,4-benzoquinol methylase
MRSYRKRAGNYDSAVRFFSLFRPFGMDISAWRREAVQALELKPGDAVVDIGCGTGLNFPFLYAAVGPRGKIIGVDLCDAMLEQAHQKALKNDWQNVELVCVDAAQFEYPPNLDGVISTFALILVPECARTVARGCCALRQGGRFSVLDMAWPAAWSMRWRHMLFFLRSYGVTRETLDRRPWETVWRTMDEHLGDVLLKRFWFGLMYLATGVR